MSWICTRRKRPNRWVDSDGRNIICHAETARWWDIRSAKVIKVTLSTHQSDSSYLCIPSDSNVFPIYIQDENTEEFHKYSCYSAMYNAVKAFSRRYDYWYLSVDIVEDL